ncbi:hypothetical protein ACJ73_00499 [Blastomyces percursus]|uniref:Uncharacterized protein n=1 Tax=Blastomyces percursus TaxID=1658174 RepID=A0A1J9QGY5_9EURO|nr:hypothetical protein ACJ73_00499 [Blastomyces percursus]
MSPRLIAVLHGIWTGGFAGFYLIAMCIYAAVTVQQFEYSSSFSSRRALKSSIKAWNGIMILAGVLLVAGMLSTAYTLLSAMSRGSNKTSSLRGYAPFLAATCVGFGATFLAEQILTYRVFWESRGAYVTPGEYYAALFLYMFFYSASFLLAVLIVTSPALTNNEPPGVVQETFQQPASYAYPVQPNPPGPNVPLMQQYPQQSYPPVAPVQPYYANQQPYDPHNPQPPAAYC